MISTLSLKEFKGITRDYRFRPGNYITGLNFSGKSAIDQAIRCLVLGYVPGQAKTSAAMKQFASAYPMRIAAEFSIERGISGPRASIAFDRSKGGKITQTEDSPLNMSERVRVLFDPTIFFGLADSARISKACELVQSGAGDTTALSTAVFRKLTEKHGPDAKNLTTTPEYRLYKEWQAKIAQSKTFNELLAESETFWKAKTTEQNAEKTRLKKMAEGLADASAVEAELAKLPPRHEVAAKNDRIAAELRAIDESIGAINATRNDAANRKTRRDKIAANAASADELKTSLATLEESAAKTDASIQELKAKLKTATDEYRTACEAKATPVFNEVRTDDFTTGAEQGKTYKGDVSITLNDQGLPEIVSIDSWHEVLKPEDVAAAEENTRAEEYEISTRITEASDMVESLTQQIETASRRKDTIQTAITNTTVRLESANSAKEELARLDAAAAEPNAYDPEKVAKLADDRNKKAAEQKEVDGQLDAIAGFEQDTKRIAESAEQRKKVEDFIKVLDGIVDLIAAKKVEMVSESIDGPLAVANKLAEGILKGPLVFQEGELGMLDGQRFISQRVFSGTETAIVMMGLTAGLAAKSEMRVLLLDELGRLDNPNAARLIANLIGMVEAKDIDQFIVIGPPNEDVQKACAAFTEGDEGKLKIITVE